MTLILACILICTCFFVTAGAEELQSNTDLRNARSNELMAMSQRYNSSGIDFITSDGETAVFTIISGYNIVLGTISQDELAQNLDSTRAKIELYYQRGVAVDTLAWIYFPENDKFDEEDVKLLDEKFREMVGKIESKKLADSIDAQIYATYENQGFCAEMYVSMYTARLNALREEGDSATAKAIIDNAIESLKGCTVNTDNTQYEKILADAIRAVGIQRNQDLALRELEESFGILFGEELADNALYTSAAKDIDADTTETIADMNGKLLTSVKAALDSLKSGDRYVVEFYDLLKSRCDAADNADNTMIADLSACLGNYAIDLYRAETKDTVLEYISGKECSSDEYLVNLEKEYNGTDGILDGEMLVGGIDLEAHKAMRLADLYEKLVSGIANIKDKKGADASLDAINSAFSDGEKAIESVNDGAALTDAFDNAMAAVAVEEYLTIYTDTVEIDPEKVTVADKGDVEEAIAGLGALDGIAKTDARIISARDKLTELYKRIAKQEIEAALGNTLMHKNYAGSLNSQVDALTPEGIGTIIEDTAEIVGKAKPMDSILDRYCEILLTADYPDFTDEEGDALTSITNEACHKILDGAENNLDVAEKAIIDLNRSEASSRIAAKRREAGETQLSAVEENIKSIIAEATDKIDAETEADKIKAIADKAIFDIQKEFDVQSITDRTDALEDEIDGDGDFTLSQKESLISALEKISGEGIEAVRAAEDDGARIDANEEFDKALKELQAEKDAKSSAMEVINDKRDEIAGNIGGLEGLDGEEKALYEGKLADAYEKACEDVGSAATEEVEGVKVGAVEAMELIDGTAKALNTVNLEYSDAEAEVDGMGYLTDEEQEEIKTQLDSVRDDAAEKLDIADGIQAVVDAETEAKESIALILADAIDKDGKAKDEQTSAAEDKLNGIYGSVIEQIDGSLYLDDAKKDALKNEAKEILDGGKAAVESATDTEGIDKAVGDTEKKFDALNDKTELQNGAAKEEQSAALGSVLDEKKQEIIDEINALTYLTEGEKAEAIAEIESIVADAKDKIGKAQSTEELGRIEDEAMTALDGSCRDAVALDLENAKKHALSLINKDGEVLEELIDGFIYLGDGDVAALKAELSELLDKAEQDINDAEAVAEVEALRDACLGELEDMEKEALESEDDACLGIFTPIAIALAVIAVAEAVALVILTKKKKAMSAATGASTAVYAAAAPALRAIPVAAWTVTLILAVADIVMAVLIVRLILQVLKLQPKAEKKPAPVKKPEPVAEPAEETKPEEAVAPVVEPVVDDFEDGDDEPTMRVMKARKLKIKQAIINIDQLEAYFNAGDTVDMDVLKRLELIPKSAGCIKVLARGELHKPLNVVAREFSAVAKEMIVKAGGQANYDMIDIVIEEN